MQSPCAPESNSVVRLVDNQIAEGIRLLNCGEISQRLGVSIHTVRGWVFDRKIPHLKVGKLVRFVWADVMRWAQSKGA